ncbi:MAG TPA: DNA polymerase II [Myxococcota bacterium]|nr:DNA polymerase II [Myxococcota bacterium]
MPTGFLLQPTYRVRDGIPVVQLYGQLEDGRAFLVEDDRFRPYFFVRAADADLLRGDPRAQIAESGLRDFAGQALVRVVVPVPAAVPPLRDRVAATGRPTYEGDVRFPYRYLIDAGVRAGIAIEGEGTERGALVHFANPALAPAEVRPALRVVSIDLETEPSASEVWSIALLGDGIDEVHLLGARAGAEAITHAEERALLAAAAQRIREIDPDVITGWNVVEFDLRILAQRCAALRVPLELGRVAGEMLFQQELGFTREARAVVPGRVVLDGLALVRDALRLDDYRLGAVAQELLGRGKRIAAAADPVAEIVRMYRDDPTALVAYNREDARLVLDILEREGLLSLAVERSLLSGMPLDRVGASIASFDRLYLPELRRRGFAAPSVDPDRKAELVQGGAVLDSVPGLFTDVAVFDFKSLYPSLIRTFQLDPLAHALAGEASFAQRVQVSRSEPHASEVDRVGERRPEDAIAAPGGARFAREGAILPGVIERFMARRAAAKARGDHHADQAIKIMMNALFGVLGAASCRFFDPAIANAITGFGQEILHRTRDAFEAAGVPVIYGDTDSVFVHLGARAQKGARGEAERLRDHVQERIAEHVHSTYRVASHLELELEGIYERFLMPRVRSGRSGSKKRYAGWREGQLEVVGLESVRRDWPAVARRLQRGLLERAFTDAPVLPFVREVVDAVRRGELDAELVYVKRVRKGSLDRYTGPAPPHVQAARKAGARAGPLVRYVVTAGGPEPVFHGQPLPPDIDRRHYVERVLRPIAEAILEPLGLHSEDALGEPRQLGLL